MKLSHETERLRQHENAFGFLRLLFASLVIVSHIPQQATGDDRYEPLRAVFGTVSFGGLAVFGFFIISGYLIAGSAETKRSSLDYMVKRIARIYPAFIVASLVCIFVVAPLSGAPSVGLKQVITSVARIAFLQPPEVAGTFSGTHHPALNGSMWTISYEFRCYVLMLLFAAMGLLQARYVAPAIAAALLLIAALTPEHVFAAFDAGSLHPGLFVGRLKSAIQFTAMFFAGAAFYVFKEHVRLTHGGALIAAALLLVGLSGQLLAEIAIATAGGYLIFYIAQIGGHTWLSKINNKNDISYGIYLYAWPIGKLVMWYWPDLNLAVVVVATLMLSIVCGLASWFAIEKPVMQIIKTRARPALGLAR